MRRSPQDIIAEVFDDMFDGTPRGGDFALDVLSALEREGYGVVPRRDHRYERILETAIGLLQEYAVRERISLTISVRPPDGATKTPPPGDRGGAG